MTGAGGGGEVAGAPPSSPIGRRVLRATVSNLLGRGVSVVAVFLMTPFILAQLGPAGYGLWVLVGSLAGYGVLLDLGIGGAVVRFVARYAARGETERISAIVATASRLYLVLGALAFALAALLAPAFPDLFRVPAEDRDTAVLLVLVTGVSVAISIALAPASSVLRGLQRYDIYNAVNTLTLIGSSLGTVAALLAGWGVVGMVAVSIPATIAGQLINIFVLRRIRPDIRIGYANAQRAMVRPIISYSLSIFAVQVSSRLETKTDEIVIGAFLPVSAITPYALARKLRELALTLTDQFTKVLFPLAAQLDARDERHRLRTTYLTGTRVSLSLFMPLGVSLVILGGPLLAAWVGPVYQSAADVVVVLTIAALFDALTWPAGYVLQGMGRNRILAWTAIFAGIANILVSVALIGPLGVLGVAYGTLLPVIGQVLFVVLPYSMRTMQVGVSQLVRQVILPAAVPAVVMVVTVELLLNLIPPTSLPAVMLIGATGAALYGLVYFNLPAARSERRIVLDFAGALIRPLRH